ncbi:hypothetical protein [Okeania sp. KiyG1]|uniref:hypothetical protein n=1 Tax=Okeania sp. KiyG1 TaxID=2720165 RepID=UPI001922A0EB|nr:hypothetical protein [Okeania sp. KiyG1]GGA01132.1 hypothetical protein CYANOKiyG1_12930 [Okeania sp. KiyG1]
MNDSELLYKYKNKNTTLVQPELRFGVYPPSETQKKLISRYVYRYGLRELKEFVKEQYWKLVDFVPGLPGAEKEISYTRETGLELHSFEEIGSKLGISSSQEVGVDGFKLRNEVSKELSRLTGESVTISEKTSKQHITKIPPQSFEWYFVIYQLIDVYTINTVRYRPVNYRRKPNLVDLCTLPLLPLLSAAEASAKAIAEPLAEHSGKVEHALKLVFPHLFYPSKALYDVAEPLLKPLAESLAADADKVEADIADQEKANIAEKNFEFGLKQYSGMPDCTFKSETFEVPTLYFCEKCDPPLK